MCHIDHEDSAYLVRHTANTGVIPLATISRSACNNQFGLILTRNALQLVVIHATCVLANTIRQSVEHKAGEVNSRTVTQVAAVTQIQSKERVTSLHTSHEYGHISLCAGVRLYINPFCVIELFQALTSHVFRQIDNLAAAVITFARIAFRIFIGQHATHSL